MNPANEDEYFVDLDHVKSDYLVCAIPGPYRSNSHDTIQNGSPKRKNFFTFYDPERIAREEKLWYFLDSF